MIKLTLLDKLLYTIQSIWMIVSRFQFVSASTSNQLFFQNFTGVNQPSVLLSSKFILLQYYKPLSLHISECCGLSEGGHISREESLSPRVSISGAIRMGSFVITMQSLLFQISPLPWLGRPFWIKIIEDIHSEVALFLLPSVLSTCSGNRHATAVMNGSVL